MQKKLQRNQAQASDSESAVERSRTAFQTRTIAELVEIHSYGSIALIETPGPLDSLTRFIIACSRVTKRSIRYLTLSVLECVISAGIQALQVFALDDDYSFGVLQSNTTLAMVHGKPICRQPLSTLKTSRYTSRSLKSLIHVSVSRKILLTQQWFRRRIAIAARYYT